MTLKEAWNKFWYLMWKDNSLKGWVLSVLVLFIFIKFLFLPGLGLITGTSLPLAIVESCSMYHKDNLFSDFDSWYERHDDKYEDFDITKSEFKEFGMSNGFTKGDILFVTGANPENLELGDIIIFEVNRQNPIIHRIVKIEEVGGERIFSTIGDNNNGQFSFEEKITEDQIVGKATLKIAPYLGWIKLFFYESLRPVNERGLCEEK